MRRGFAVHNRRASESLITFLEAPEWLPRNFSLSPVIPITLSVSSRPKWRDLANANASR